MVEDLFVVYFLNGRFSLGWALIGLIDLGLIYLGL